MCSAESTDSSMSCQWYEILEGNNYNNNRYWLLLLLPNWVILTITWTRIPNINDTPEIGTLLTENWNYRSQIYWHTNWSATLVVYTQLMVKWGIWYIHEGFLIWIIPQRTNLMELEIELYNWFCLRLHYTYTVNELNTLSLIWFEHDSIHT